jgi:hypothetical protein
MRLPARFQDGTPGPETPGTMFRPGIPGARFPMGLLRLRNAVL